MGPRPTTTIGEIRQFTLSRNEIGIPVSITGKMYFHEYLRHGSNVTLDIKHLTEYDDNRGYYIIKTSFTDIGTGYIAYKDEEIK
jgi:hypothetical protein